MPAKKNKSKQKPTKLRETNQNKYILLRDIDTLTQLMVDYDRVSSNKNAKINVAAEVIYTKTDQSVGHGTVLTIGSKEECQELLDALEKHNTMKSKEDIQPIVTIDDHEEIQEIEDEREQQSITKSSNASPVIEHVNNKTTVSNESPSPKNKRSLLLTNKDLNVSEENASASKRSKSEDKSNDYQRARIMILQEKCEKLQERIEEMENNWMPRPDPITINYFAKIVSICTGEKSDDNDVKSDKLIDIMEILTLSEIELGECTDKKSIRNTCRKLVRRVFQTELADSTIQFGKILKKQAAKVVAIRKYGRLMHPAESLKFTDGDLNNAMGSDFYQRDRELKLRDDSTENKDAEKAEVEDDI
ncbi:unnamed protein product [Rotaria magnacalcarata]|uniref:Uncharacterized protein n=1 Tax=Rotaria magnacalcarata TaxID=392030 RepID=A0A819PEQ7_9BILA|nr:unnamed protein product [Rotaria magnacalcarata]CAF4015856.1 unnamed protein product [Rotaria magnacalcarata]